MNSTVRLTDTLGQKDLLWLKPVALLYFILTVLSQAAASHFTCSSTPFLPFVLFGEKKKSLWNKKKPTVPFRLVTLCKAGVILHHADVRIQSCYRAIRKVSSRSLDQSSEMHVTSHIPTNSDLWLHPLLVQRCISARSFSTFIPPPHFPTLKNSKGISGWS